MTQIDWLSDSPQRLSLPQSEIWLWRAWLAEPVAADCYQDLLACLNWQQPELFIAGKMRKIPRRQAWHGDPAASYQYSGRRFTPSPWTETLTLLRSRLEQQCQAPFNSVLINHYRNGADSMGWHRDNEPELGKQPVIASLSLGATRRFCFKPANGGAQALAVELHSGDLLLMAGETQQHWLHALPKTRKPVDGRLNLTFRAIK